MVLRNVEAAAYRIGFASDYYDLRSPSFSLVAFGSSDSSAGDVTIPYTVGLVRNDVPSGIDPLDALQGSLAATAVYDLQGRRVATDGLRPGIYVREGRKFVVR